MLSLIALASAAWPCAAFFPEDDSFVESAGQEAIFQRVEDDVVVKYLVQYEGDSASFGWIVPIPGTFVSVNDDVVETFEEIRALTEPTLHAIYNGDQEPFSGCGCSEEALSKGGEDDFSGGDSADTASNGVEVITETMTATYMVTVVEATDTAELETWLEENGWNLGASLPSLQDYVEEGGFQFLLFAVNPESADTPEGGAGLAPVSIRYTGEDMVFPARMARHGQPQTLTTTLYVIGDTAASLSGGWSTEVVGDIEGQLGDMDPSDAFLARLWEIGGESPGYGLTWAGEAEWGNNAGRWVTRFDSWTSVEVQLSDPLLTLDGEENSVKTVVVLYEEFEASDSAWLVFLPLFGLGWSVRRRR